MIRRAIVVLGITALALAGAGPAQAVKRGPTLSPRDQFKWEVRGFKTPTGTAAACPPTIDGSDVLCDHVTLGVVAVDWSRNIGALSIGISFSSSNNFNLYVFQASNLVRSSEGSSGGSESVTIPNPSGTYEIRVVPVQIATSLLQGGAGYAGVAKFAVQSKPSAVQQPSNVRLPTGASSGTQPSTSAPRYRIPSSGYSAGYPAYGGSYSPGGLYQGPDYSGGGTSQFSGTDASSGKLYYQSAYGGPVNGGVPQKVADSTDDVAVGSSVARAPRALWLLLPLALLLLGGVAYLVVEPEGRPETIEGQAVEIPSRVALGGIFIKSAAGLGRGVLLVRRWLLERLNTAE